MPAVVKGTWLRLLGATMLLGCTTPGPHSSAASGQEADAATIQGERFSLAECVLTARSEDGETASVSVGLPGECVFARMPEGELQSTLTDAGLVALVVSSAPLPEGRWCDTRIRAVLLDPDRLAVSADQQDIRLCSRGPFDDMLVETLAQSVDVP